MKNPQALKAEILRLTREYSALVHGEHQPGAERSTPFVPGRDVVPYAARVFSGNEVEAAVAASLDFWLTLGPEGEAFEREFATWLGVKHTLLVNSGSSANLLALTALTSPKLTAARRLLPGDEVITAAAGFPTTVAPIVQNGGVPVFLDCDPLTGNPRMEQLESAYSPGKTKAVMVAHTLANPIDLGVTLDFCRRHGLWLIEDNCDALGSTYAMPVERARRLGLDHLLRVAEAADTDSASPAGRSPAVIRDGRLIAPTGSWGDLSTQSFYPPHHLTTGEGGAVNIVSHSPLKSIVESFRDWGRDCWCASGQSNSCGRRFDWQLGELPAGYDHKYIYSHLGYNLKPLDVQAAIGREQLRRLPAFIDARRRHWDSLRAGLADLGEFFEFSLPMHATRWSPSGFAWDDSGCRTECSWFGFMLRVRDEAPFSRTDLARHLDERKIGNRMLFGGNLLRQPAWVRLQQERPGALRTIGPLAGADQLMRTALFIGTYPGLTAAMVVYMIDTVRAFVESRRKQAPAG